MVGRPRWVVSGSRRYTFFLRFFAWHKLAQRSGNPILGYIFSMIGNMFIQFDSSHSHTRSSYARHELSNPQSSAVHYIGRRGTLAS